MYIYRMIHWVWSTFKSEYGHLKGIFLTCNFAWAFSIPFAISVQKGFAKFWNLTPAQGAVGGVGFQRGLFCLLFGPQPLLQYYLLFGPHPIITVIKNQWWLHYWLQFECQESPMFQHFYRKSDNQNYSSPEFWVYYKQKKVQQHAKNYWKFTIILLEED